MDHKDKNILIVEDEAVIALLIEETLRSKGYHVSAVMASGEDAVEYSLHTSPDLILMDIKLNGEMSGSAAAKMISEKINVPIVFLTAHSDPNTRKQALQSNPYGYLLKPFRADSLISAVEAAFQIFERDIQVRESESKLRSVFHSSHLGIVLLDGDFRIIELNSAVMEITGYTQDDLAGQKLTEICPESIGDAFWERLEGVDVPIPLDLIRKDGSLVCCEAEANFLGTIGKAENCRTLLLKDITKTKKLRQQLDIVYSAIETTRVGLVICDPNGQIIFVNSAEAELHGYEKDELIGKRAAMLGLPEDRAQIPAKVVDNFERETMNMKKDGSVFPVRLVSNLVCSEENEVVAIVTTCEDISARKRHEKELVEGEQRYKKLSAEFQALLEGIQDSICLFSTDFQLVWANRSTEKVFQQIAGIEDTGYEKQLIGCTREELCKDIVEDCDECAAVQTLRSGKGQESRQVLSDNQIVRRITFPLFDEAGDVSGIIQLTRDITDQVSLKEQAEFFSRMNSLGEIAAGLGHEINNPNGLIKLNAQLLEKTLSVLLPLLDENIEMEQPVGKISYRDVRSQVQDSVAKIIGNTQRIQGIVEHLREFSVPSHTHILEKISINEVVERSLDLLQPMITKHTSHLAVLLDKSDPVVSGNFQRLEQVVVNIVMNALQALEEKSCGVTIETKIDTESNSVSLTVTDEGKGISEEDMDKVYLPFYSTKKATGGSGLGLSIVERIVQDHNGAMKISSEPGKGCMVNISLPFIRHT